MSEPLAAREAEKVSMWLPWGCWSLSPIHNHEVGTRKSAQMRGGEGMCVCERERFKEGAEKMTNVC